MSGSICNTNHALGIASYGAWHTSNPALKTYHLLRDSLQTSNQGGKLLEIGGRQAIAECEKNANLEEQFYITSDLLSLGLKLRNWKLAKQMDDSLVSLHNRINHLVIYSPYLLVVFEDKHATFLRLLASDAKDVNRQQELFIKAKRFTAHALDIAQVYLKSETMLIAQVTFNAGAIECDNPKGDCYEGLKLYRQAMELFETLLSDPQEGHTARDYLQRILIHMCHAYLDQGHIQRAKEIVKELKKASLSPYTIMYLCCLEARISKIKMKDKLSKALKLAENLGAQDTANYFQSQLRA